MVNDKRKSERDSIDDLRAQLNAEQRITLGELEILGWSLKFVRRPLFQEPVPVVSRWPPPAPWVGFRGTKRWAHWLRPPEVATASYDGRPRPPSTDVRRPSRAADRVRIPPDADSEIHR